MKRAHGFSLFEILLVMVIVGVFIAMGTNYVQQRTIQARIDKSVMDMQQILNAGMSYYVANGKWPDRDFNMNPQQAIAYALIDEVLTKQEHNSKYDEVLREMP